MYIKAIKKRNPAGSTTYVYHRLVESYRTSRGPRQMTLLNLGSLQLPKEQWKPLADRIAELVYGQQHMHPVAEEIEQLARHYAPLLAKRSAEIESGVKKEAAEQTDFRRIDLNSLENKTARTIGAEYVGYQYYRRLKIDEVLESVGLTKQQQAVAALLIVARLVAPGSERATLEWAKYISGLDELMGIRISEISLNMAYRVSDKIYENKAEIERLLRGEEKKLFDLQDKIILYDLSNTYFEGSSYEGDEIRYGKSKDKRHDCPLITVGLVIDEWGFAKRSEFFPGAVDEPGSLEQILKQLGGEEGSTVVIDAGIASEEILQLLRAKGYHYVCVARGKPVSEEQAEELVTIKAERDNKIDARLVKGDKEWVLICDSSRRRAKEQSMKSRFESTYEQGLETIKASLSKKGGTKRYEKVLERIGRLKEKSHGIHQYYEVELDHCEDIVTDVRYRYLKAEQAEQRYSGRYYIRTSRKDLSEKEIWQLYITLNGIEDSFRSLKSELGIRPVYHRLVDRIKAHIFITLLAYHLLNAIRFRLRGHGLRMRWSTVRNRLATHVLSTTSMKTEEGTTVYIRTPSTPELFQRDIYRALGLRDSPIRRRKYEN